MVLGYNGFIGSVERDDENNIFFGSLQYIRDLVTYEGRNIKELKKNFVEAIDKYTKVCKDCNKEPERSA